MENERRSGEGRRERDQRSEDQLRGEAERQVDAFEQAFLRRHGISAVEIPEIIEQVRWLREHRRMIGRIIGGTMLTVMGSLVLAALALIWEGLIGRLRG